MDSQLNIFQSQPSDDEADSNLPQALEQQEDDSWISNTLQRVEGIIGKDCQFFVTQDGEEIKLLIMDRSRVKPKMHISAIVFTNQVGGRYAMPGTLRNLPNDPSQQCR